jgi:hypothetical protein
VAEIKISQTDLRDAEAFLAAFLSESVPQASFAPGSAVRDFLVTGFAYLYSFLRGEVSKVDARRSLKRIQAELTDADDISQFVDELLSNWFMSRKDGSLAHVVARFHFTQRKTAVIPKSARFWRTNNMAFAVDSETNPYVIPAASMLPTYDGRGTLLDYVVEVPLVALRTGEGYNISPGTFARVEAKTVLPFLSYVENTEKGSSGAPVEPSADLIARAQNAITVRNLINARSCDAVLREEFPEITGTFSVGFGDEEMVRDRFTGPLAHIELHTGGHYDTYFETALTQVEELATVGGYFRRPDNLTLAFRDPELTYDNGDTFTSLGVVVGDVVYVRDGILGAPRGYIITDVTDHTLLVDTRTPFSQASDELEVNSVTYSIGHISPEFADIDFGGGVYYRVAAPSTTYEEVPYGTSRSVSEPGKIILSRGPAQEVLRVEIVDPSALDAAITDPETGTIIFHNRSNGEPVISATPTETEYQVSIKNPESAQSWEAVTEVVVGYGIGSLGLPDREHFDGTTLRVVYKTPASMSSIHAYVRNPSYRVLTANHLVRARHPVWISLNIEYRLKDTATEVLDETAAAEFLEEHINAFDPNDTLDVSDIMTALRSEFPVIGAVYPFTVNYTFHSPDGQLVTFETSDVISIFTDEGNGTEHTNSGDMLVPEALQAKGITGITTGQLLRTYFAFYGVTDKTVIYRTKAESITLVNRG